MFADRHEAGHLLAQRLLAVTPALSRVVVLGLPRGGVPVASEVAVALKAPLDVIVVRKLGVPGQPELAFGAVGEGGVRVLNQDVVRSAGLTKEQIDHVVVAEAAVVDRRVAEIRRRYPRLDLRDRTGVIVDDGIATGATVRAACQIASAHGALRIVVAVPVAPRGWRRRSADVADDYVAVSTPHDFTAVGAHYLDFRPTSDQEVLDRLGTQRGEAASGDGL